MRGQSLTSKAQPVQATSLPSPIPPTPAISLPSPIPATPVISSLPPNLQRRSRTISRFSHPHRSRKRHRHGSCRKSEMSAMSSLVSSKGRQRRSGHPTALTGPPHEPPWNMRSALFGNVRRTSRGRPRNGVVSSP
ncbi:hypothetical protein EI94DRAFT_98386 [Lactarius quietus]|nr:hypothetical protein EI94DRAFT_98386 [Lactarius quietus]